MDQIANLTQSNRRKLLLVYGIAMVSILALSLAGGLPPRWWPLLGYLASIIILLSGLWILFILTQRWLMQAPTSDQTTSISHIPPDIRWLLAWMLTVNSFALAIAGFWDGSWHGIYGGHFGEDFFWRPHLLLYIGMAFPVVAAAGSAVFVLSQNGRGRRNRLRDEPLVSLLITASLFTIFSALADPLWHSVFGAADMSVWSPPHFILWLGGLAVMLAILAIQMSLLGPGEWQIFPRERQYTSNKLSIVCLLAIYALTTWMILLPDDPNFILRVQGRLPWIFPALLVGFSSFIGTVSLQSIRSVGAATGVGLATVVLRMVLTATFADSGSGMDAVLASLPVLVALDAWYVFRLKTTGQPPSWISSGIAAAIGGAIPFLLPGSLFTYLQFNIRDLPLALLLAAGIATAAAWEAQIITNFLQARTASTRHETNTARWVTPLLVAITCILALFLYYFITTASPPLR